METTNGHAPSGAAKPAKKIAVQLEVFRVALGQTCHVRMLSPNYGGLFTHWHKGQSRYCFGKTCNPAVHREDMVWKGYTAAQLWIPPEPGRKGCWKPVVLEITESLELDLRGQYQRGQIWELYRVKMERKDHPPTQGLLLEEHAPESFAPDFEIRHVLMNLYHTQTIDLGHKNPMPPRSFAETEEAPPPEKLQTEEEGKKIATPEEIAKMRAEFNERKKKYRDSRST